MYCDFCGSLIKLLGRLGNLMWYRCSGCGLEMYQDLGEPMERDPWEEEGNDDEM